MTNHHLKMKITPVYTTKLTSLIKLLKRSLTWGASVFQSALVLVSEGRLSEVQRTRYLSPYRLGQGWGGRGDPEVAGKYKG